MTFGKFLLSTLSGAVVAAGVASGAAAATFGTIPDGATNEGLMPIYGTSTRDGWYGANLYLIGGGGNATITVDYLGSEAGYDNEFTFGGSTVFGTGGGTNTWPGVGSAVAFNNVADGLLNFSFLANGGGVGSAVNGSNPDDAMGAGDINFFATVVSDPSATAGTSWDLWFDDAGAGPDDNHDDMAIRITVQGGSISIIPVPAAGVLLLTGLLGFGVLGRRKQRQA